VTALADMIAGGETLEVEFKREVNDNELVEAVVCLANRVGGTLLVGIEDDRTIHGARPRHGAATDSRRIEALVSNNTRPALGVRAEMVEHAGKPILVIEVPVATIPTATSKGTYLRRVLGGDGKPACNPFFVFEQGTYGMSQDPSAAIVPAATWNDLDRSRSRGFVGSSGKAVGVETAP